MPWSLACILIIQITRSPFYVFFFRFEAIDFPSKMVSCRFSLDLPLFGLGPSSKGLRSNLWLSSNRIDLFHWTPDLGLSSKLALIVDVDVDDDDVLMIILWMLLMMMMC